MEIYFLFSLIAIGAGLSASILSLLTETIMNLYSTFAANKNAEKEGIILQYGKGTRIRVARAGGSNEKFTKVLQTLTKPYKRAIQNDTVDPEIVEDIMMRAYCRAVIKSWETNTNPDKDGEPIWTPGIESKDGDLLDVTEENIVMTFMNLKDLWEDIKEQSNKFALFRQEINEVDSKN